MRKSSGSAQCFKSMKSILNFPKSGVIDSLHGALDLDQIFSQEGMVGSGMSIFHRNLQRRVASYTYITSKISPNPDKKPKRCESHSDIRLGSQNPDREMKRSGSQSQSPIRKISQFLALKVTSGKGPHESPNIAKSVEMKSIANSEKNVSIERHKYAFEDTGKIPSFNEISFRGSEYMELDPRADQGPFGMSPALPDEVQLKATLNSLPKVDGESGLSEIRESEGIGGEQIRNGVAMDRANNK
jgi:hypothetical protein